MRSIIYNHLVRRLEEIKKLSLDYDVIYIGHNSRSDRIICMIEDTELNPCHSDQCTFGYIVTFRGAQRLVNCMMPMSDPVDVRMADERAKVTQFTCEPCMFG